MRAAFAEKRHLRRIARSLRVTDPHLTCMLAVFAKVTAGEGFPAREQIRRRQPRPLRMVIVAASVVAGFVANLALVVGEGSHRAVRRCAAAVRSLHRPVRRTPWPDRAPGSEPGGPGGHASLRND